MSAGVLTGGSSEALRPDPALTCRLCEGEGDVPPVCSEVVRNRKDRTGVGPNQAGASLWGLVLPKGALAFVIDSPSLPPSLLPPILPSSLSLPAAEGPSGPRSSLSRLAYRED